MSKSKAELRQLAREKKKQPESKVSNSGNSIREMFESLVVAVILAMLVRAFLAEAFVIPTGSMAPTLLGGHKETYCPQCGFRYLVGDASASESNSNKRVEGVCPNCRHLNTNLQANPYNGDRIIVNKFIYDISEPKRWDIIVFRFPGRPAQNYIKRLVGLPNESIVIKNGDIWVKKLKIDSQEADTGYSIARKPADVVWAMKHTVADTNYIPLKLLDIAESKNHWRWIADEQDENSWVSEIEYINDSNVSEGSEDHPQQRGSQSLSISGTNEEVRWISYHHMPLLPYSLEEHYSDWKIWGQLDQNPLPTDYIQPIRDYSSYNDHNRDNVWNDLTKRYENLRNNDVNYVGDLIVATNLQVNNNSGTVMFQLNETIPKEYTTEMTNDYVNQYICSIDLASGEATFSINDGKGVFANGESEVRTITKVKGEGNYEIAFANVDDQLLLWVDDELVQISDDSMQFRSAEQFSSAKKLAIDALAIKEKIYPVKIGSIGTDLKLNRIKIYRDVYYRATNQATNSTFTGVPLDQGKLRIPADETERLQFDIPSDEFFVLGDNSPSSSDSRLWSGPGKRIIKDITPFVPREALIGKAMFIYWPRSLSEYFPLCPNIPRMGFIR